MNFLSYINLLLIPSAYALTFAPVTLPALISLIGVLIATSFFLTTISQIAFIKKTNKKNKVLALIEEKKIKLEECLTDKAQTGPYTEGFYKPIKEIYVNSSASSSYENNLDTLPQLFSENYKPRTCSLIIHKKRLGKSEEEEFRKSF